jgi:hypothetical protein
VSDAPRIAANARAERLFWLSLRARITVTAQSDRRASAVDAVESFLAESPSFPDLDATEAADPTSIERVGLAFCRQHEVVPLATSGDCVVVAVLTRPAREVAVRLEEALGRRIEAIVVPPGVLASLLPREDA